MTRVNTCEFVIIYGWKKLAKGKLDFIEFYILEYEKISFSIKAFMTFVCRRHT